MAYYAYTAKIDAVINHKKAVRSYNLSSELFQYRQKCHHHVILVSARYWSVKYEFFTSITFKDIYMLRNLWENVLTSSFGRLLTWGGLIFSSVVTSATSRMIARLVYRCSSAAAGPTNPWRVS